MANPDDAINATTESADPTHHTEIAVSRWVGQLLEDRRHAPWTNSTNADGPT